MRMTVDFRGPFSGDNNLDIQVPDNLATAKGVYLWTVEYDGGFLINYVGKTCRNARARFCEHKKWNLQGKDVLNPEYLPKGENWLVENPSLEVIRASYRLYRVFLAPIEATDDIIQCVEGELIRKLRCCEPKVRGFLGNKRPGKRLPGLDLKITAPVVLHGLTR